MYKIHSDSLIVLKNAPPAPHTLPPHPLSLTLINIYNLMFIKSARNTDIEHKVTLLPLNINY